MTELGISLAYWHWLILGIALLGAEVFVSGFILFWFGLGAILVGVLTTVIVLSLEWQLLIWALLSIGALVFWTKFWRPRWKQRTLSGMASEALAGQIGLVIEGNAGRSRGRLRFPAPLLGEDEWSFLCTEAVQIGERVRVTGLSGNTLVVARVAV